MVARTRHSITLYVHWLCCLNTKNYILLPLNQRHSSYTAAYDGVYDICSVYHVYNIRCSLYLHVYGIYSYVPTVALYMQLKFRCQLQICRSQKLTQVD